MDGSKMAISNMKGFLQTILVEPKKRLKIVFFDISLQGIDLRVRIL